MDLVACAISGAAAVYLFACALFALAFARHRPEGEYGVFALLCLALAEHAIAALWARRAHTAEQALNIDQIGWVGLIAAFAIVVHFAIRYRGVRSNWRFLLPLYGVACVFLFLNVRGMLHDTTQLGERHVLVRGVELIYRGAPLSRLGMAAYAVGAVGVIGVLVSAARAYLSGRREALAVVIGTTVLLATLVNDIGVASGAFATTYLVNAGFVAFVLGASSTYSSRHAAGLRELERRTKELRTRTRELRRSYEELRAAQEELVRKEQLAVVGELAAVIAHEVRNPLAIIANAVAGLRKPTISRDDNLTLLTILEEETSRLNRLVSDLLRYARPVNVQRQHIVISDLLERTLQIARTRKGVNVQFNVEVTEGRMWGDPNLLRQVFDNLVENAVQAMGSDGTLTVRVRAMTDEGVDGIGVDIIDTGEGMDTQVRSRARDPFFTTRPSGTGLGLAIVDRIVDAHGGRFIIDSRAGEGTTVTVFLAYGSPSEPPPKPRSKKGTSEPPPPPPPTTGSVPDVGNVSDGS